MVIAKEYDRTEYELIYIGSDAAILAEQEQRLTTEFNDMVRAIIPSEPPRSKDTGGASRLTEEG